MAEKVIPKEIDLGKVKLTPKGFVQLLVGLFVVMLAYEGAKWLFRKVVGGVKKPVPPASGGGRRAI